MLIKKIFPDAQVPIRATDGSAGYDLFAYLYCDKKTGKFSGDLPITINPNESVLIGTGIQMAIPTGYYGQIVPKSGLAAKFGIEIPNSPGIIDSDYRGHIMVLVKNGGIKIFTVQYGMKIAQIIFSKYEILEFEIIQQQLPETERGENGFGSTGE